MRAAFLASVLFFLLAGCDSDASDPIANPDVSPDVMLDDTEAPDLVSAPDLAETPDVSHEDIEDDVYIPPEPSFTFEPEGRSDCRADEAYFEDRSELFRTEEFLPVLDATCILALGTRVWVGTSAGLFVKDDGDTAFVAVPFGEASPAIVDIAEHPDGLLVASANTIYQLGEGDTATELATAEHGVDKLVPCGDELFVVGAYNIARVIAGQVEFVMLPTRAGVRTATCHDGTLWFSAGGIWRGSNEDAQLIDSPDVDVVALMADGSSFVLAASTTAVVLHPDGGAAPVTWEAAPGGVPTDGNTSLAVDTSSGGFAVGHAVGASRYDPVAERFEHFQSLRYLPSNEVRDLSFSPDGSLWVATAAGVARLYRVEITLADKAQAMLDKIDAHFWRLGGIVTVEASFDSPWSTEAQDPLRDDDNDGQWTQEALAALCYAYATTGEQRYYDKARQAVEGMMMLIDVPASDFEAAGLGRGFVTRSVVRDDEGSMFTSKASQSNWHLVHHTDGHDYYWKDDTSSDETTGHFYGFPLYYDLVAKDDAERAEVASYIVDLASTILENNYQLIDIDGEVTTHAYWNPEKLAVALDGVEACLAVHDLATCADAWGGLGFLNSVQILGAMLSAWHVSGEQRFYDAYESLITDHRYDELATFADDETMTWIDPALRNLCAHELADLAFLTLLRYDPNPQRRRLWTESLMAAWAFEAEERNPLKVLSMVAAQTECPGLDAAMRTLREYPGDLRRFFFDLSHRKDYVYGGIDRHGDVQLSKVPPYDEIRAVRWDANPYAIAKEGSRAQVHITPTFWLLPYWGLRYYGAICP